MPRGVRGPHACAAGRPLSQATLNALLKRIRACDICAAELPHGPRPIVQLSREARILIAGQAPGRRVHETGIPFDDPSGDRLRDWLNIDRKTFYDARRIAILPMGFCYPGKGSSGDRPPRPECAATWREKVMRELPAVRLVLVIGQYAMAWHLGSVAKKTLTETVRAWRDFAPRIWPLPHPSGRNNIWLGKNRWFEREVLPELRRNVAAVLD